MNGDIQTDRHGHPLIRVSCCPVSGPVLGDAAIEATGDGGNADLDRDETIGRVEASIFDG